MVAVAETRGRIVRDFYGVPGQGKPFTNRGTVVYRFQDGKIAEVQPSFDDLKIVTEQLGATLLPPQHRSMTTSNSGRNLNESVRRWKRRG